MLLDFVDKRLLLQMKFRGSLLDKHRQSGYRKVNHCRAWTVRYQPFIDRPIFIGCSLLFIILQLK